MELVVKSCPPGRSNKLCFWTHFVQFSSRTHFSHDGHVPGRFGRQASVTDIYHATMPHTMPCMMLVGVWFGLHWSLSSFFDHYVQSSRTQRLVPLTAHFIIIIILLLVLQPRGCTRGLFRSLAAHAAVVDTARYAGMRWLICTLCGGSAGLVGITRAAVYPAMTPAFLGSWHACH